VSTDVLDRELSFPKWVSLGRAEGVCIALLDALIKSVHVFHPNAHRVSDLIGMGRSKDCAIRPPGRLTNTRRCQKDRAVTHSKLRTGWTAFGSITETFYKPKCLAEPFDGSSDIVINEHRDNRPWRR
jgi:hypothetical protein